MADGGKYLELGLALRTAPGKVFLGKAGAVHRGKPVARSRGPLVGMRPCLGGETGG